MLKRVCLLLAVVGVSAAVPVQGNQPPHIVHFVADDLGFNDLGFTNDGKTLTPNIDEHVKEGIFLSNYHTFKICSPSRASQMTGRYPFNLGWYDMASDETHCAAKSFTLLPQILRNNSYRTHGTGKYDIGFAKRECTPTYGGGFESYFGYYMACEEDYFYHWCPLATGPCQGTHSTGIDLTFNTNTTLSPAKKEANGTYNAHLFTEFAKDTVARHDPSQPLYLYVAPQSIHLGCAKGYDGGNAEGVQAPCSTMEANYKRQVNDTWKMAGAMVTELDYIVGNVTASLKDKGMWDDTVFLFTSDNGGPLPHSTNSPKRGGKWTFWQGGVNVMAYLSGGRVPPSRRGSVWNGMLHSSDILPTLVQGVANARIPDVTGPTPIDGFNVLPALLADTASPRNEVIHQVNSTTFNEGVQSIQRGDLKLIRGSPGDNRVQSFPAPGDVDVPYGLTGGLKETGTDHCRAPPYKSMPPPKNLCNPFCLFNVTADPSESHDLAALPAYGDVIGALNDRLNRVGLNAPSSDLVHWFIDDEKKDFLDVVCARLDKEGILEPVDW